MNKTSLLIVIASLSLGRILAQGQDPVLMKINNRPVTKSEFEYLYHKNNTSSQQSLDEYVKLFTDYKLKVEEAISLGMDTTKSFISEYEGYKNQIAQPYLTDTVSEQVIARRQYDRMGENIRASHILVRLPQGQVLPKDTLEAYEKAISIRNMIVGKDGRSFEEVAAEYSEDPSAKQMTPAGYLGWGTALMFVSPFEDGMYSTPVGEVSMPVRSTFGYHLIKVHEKRPDIGKANVSHIMFGFSQRDPSQQEIDSLKNIADQVYSKLQAGENYEELAKEYSTDKRSGQNGGSMGWLRVGVGVPDEFMNAAFALQNAGDYTPPVKTDFGYHIIKLNERGERESWNEVRGQIIRQIKGSDLLDKINLMEMQKLTKEYAYTLDKKAYNELLAWANEYYPTDSVFLARMASNNKTLITINGKKYDYNDFSDYLSKKANLRYTVSTDLLANAIDNFILSRQKETYTSSLPERHPDYRNLVKEYHDGILLFNIMNQEIWENAANDTIGLTKYFNENKTKYKWDAPRYKGYIVYCKDEATLQSAQKLSKELDLKENLNNYLKSSLNNDSVNVVFARKGVWAKGENKYIDSMVFEEPVELEPLAEYPYYFVSGNLIEVPEEYTDVRGMVISDLQEQKEKEWMIYLRKKYPVEINDAVLKTIK